MFNESVRSRLRVLKRRLATTTSRLLDPAQAKRPLALTKPQTGCQISIIVVVGPESSCLVQSLETIAAQQLDHALYEVVVAGHGASNRLLKSAQRWARKNRGISVRVVATPATGEAQARNLVLDGPTAPWVTFATAGDRLDTAYLSALWEKAAPGIVVATEQAFLAQRRAIGDIRFDPSLECGANAVFWMEVLASSQASHTLTAVGTQASIWSSQLGGDPGVDLVAVPLAHRVAAIAALQRVAGRQPHSIAVCDAVCALMWAGMTDGAEGDGSRGPEVYAALATAPVLRAPQTIKNLFPEWEPPRPVVSVIVVTHNYSAYLAEALDSVFGQKGFDAGEVEVIVVDDWSTDDTPEVLEGYGDAIQVIRQPQAGPTVAMYRALETARGEFVAFLDSDDSWTPRRLRRGVSVLQNNPEVALVHSDMKIVDGAGNRLRASFFAGRSEAQGASFGDYLLRNRALTSAITVRRDIAVAAPHAPDWVWCRDWWLAIHASLEGEIAVIDKALVRYRRHGHNVNGLINRSAEKLRSLELREVRVRRLFLSQLDVTRAEEKKLRAALNEQIRATSDLLSRGMSLAEIFEVTDSERASAAQSLSMWAQEPESDDGVRHVVRAYALDPASQTARTALASKLQLNWGPLDSTVMADDEGSTLPLGSPRIVEPRLRRSDDSFVGVALIDELTKDPELLIRWFAAIEPRRSTLWLLACGDEAGEASRRLVRVLKDRGLDGRSAHPVRVLMGSDRSDLDHWSKKIDVVVSRAPVAGLFDDLPTTADPDVLRLLSVERWSSCS